MCLLRGRDRIVDRRRLDRPLAVNELAQRPFGGSGDSKALDACSDNRKAPIRYDTLQIILHWTTVVLVVVLYSLAQVWGFLPKPTSDQLVEVHISLGVLLAGVVLVRIFWRLSFARRLPAAETGVMELAAKLGQAALYLLLIAVGRTRPLHALGRSKGYVSFFSACSRSPRHTPVNKGLAQELLPFHYWIATILIVVATGHACIALFHDYCAARWACCSAWRLDYMFA